MSLYVGHVPAHLRRDDLERAFQRFGQCNVQLKSGYGFVVYDAIANAERALRVMTGKIICGEQLSLGWSNRQPKPFRRADKSIRIYEPYRKRRFKEVHDGVGTGHTQGQRDFETDASCVRTFDRSVNRSDYAFDRETGNIDNTIDELGEGKDLSSKEVVANELDPVENDRWGEPVIDALTGLDMENDNDFDRYEPYRGLDRSYEDKNQVDCSFSGPDHGSPHEKGQREHSFEKTDVNFIKRRTQRACYNCGVVGHIARKCPKGDARRERFGKYKHKRDEINSRSRTEGRLKRPRYNSWERTDGRKDPSMLEKHGRDREESHPIKTKKLVSGGESSSESKGKHRNKHRAESQIKKETKKHGTAMKAHKKRRKMRSETSSLSSDSSTDTSRSDSQFDRSASDASQRSSSMSRSSASQSVNSGSKSVSKSPDTKSVSCKSQSRSGVGRSPALSISLNQNSPFSMKSEPVDVSLENSPKNKFDTVASADFRQLSSANIDNSELEGSFLSSKDEDPLAFSEVDGRTYGHVACSFEQKEWNPSIEPLKDVADISGKFSENPAKINNLQGSSTCKLNNCMAINSARVTAQELLLAFRHYGLVAPDEDESGISVEKYFGAARLWPWEMIYFRRMKKGAISTENYAKRLEQNQEFGIVDKYIRSSSGWGECD
ncbi:hypothetical protein J5N97_021335 [Dioscorea zingiberensis]|uniref:Uncharacterized protein n=1 Tax=Dioscorea zingiberensis TaxID=325984 RepID=A0A9D5CHM6_9LILI|nr:hypothetical protein J5N97_021335 [Dioscorea zingiberensis]